MKFSTMQIKQSELLQQTLALACTIHNVSLHWSKRECSLGMFNYKKYFHQASQNNVMIKIQIPSYPASMLLV